MTCAETDVDGCTLSACLRPCVGVQRSLVAANADSGGNAPSTIVIEQSVMAPEATLVIEQPSVSPRESARHRASRAARLSIQSARVRDDQAVTDIGDCVSECQAPARLSVWSAHVRANQVVTDIDDCVSAARLAAAR